MAIYLLTYDLNKEASSAAYKPVWDELKRLGAHRVLESVWLVNVTNTAKELHDHFKALLDNNDSLFVTSVRKSEYWYSNAKAGTNEWLSKNPPA
jgi:CRISPR-associated endonuclease Cas2